jgi:hypothetical protein
VNLFVGMTTIIFFWIISIFLLLGVGIFFQRILQMEVSSVNNIFFFFWFGLAFAIFILQLWHLWFKIDWKTVVFFSFISLCGLFWHYKSNLELARENIPKSKSFWFLMLIVVIVAANFSLGFVIPYDAGLYHLQSVRWIRQYPIIPGLGNLHSKLAFNNSSFLFAALLEQNVNLLKSFRVTNGLFLFVLFMHLSISSFRLLGKINPLSKKSLGSREKVLNYEIFESLLLASVINIVLRGSVTSISPDILIFILGIVTASKLLMLLSRERKIEDHLLFIFIMSALGTTVKGSFFFFGLVASLIALISWLRIKKREETLKIKPILLSGLIVPALILLPWIARNIILSGYLIYPCTIVSFPVEWRVPLKVVINESRWIRSWARLPGVSPEMVLVNWQWIRPWVSSMFSKQNIFDVFIPIALAVEGIILLCIDKHKQNQDNSYFLAWIFLLLPISNLIFWFLAAPSLRFAGASFWVLGVGFFIVGIIKSKKFIETKRIIFLNFLIINFLAVGEQLPDFLQNLNKKIQEVPVGHMKEFETNSGLIIYTPEEGDQCWNFKLPCTPYPDPDLKLRDGKDIKKGFKIFLEH